MKEENYMQKEEAGTKASLEGGGGKLWRKIGGGVTIKG